MVTELILAITSRKNFPTIKHLKSKFEYVDIDDGWHAFYFNQIDSEAFPIFYVCNEEKALLNVTDVLCKGDQFELSVDGDTFITSITNKNDCNDPFCADPELAFKTNGYSKVSKIIEPGFHELKIRSIKSPFGSGVGFIQIAQLVQP